MEAVFKAIDKTGRLLASWPLEPASNAGKSGTYIYIYVYDNRRYTYYIYIYISIFIHLYLYAYLCVHLCWAAFAENLQAGDGMITEERLEQMLSHPKAGYFVFRVV